MTEAATAGPSDESGWHGEKEDMLMMVMVVLLMLLSVVIWVAFCVAVRKTARKFIELKRARRRQSGRSVYEARQEELPSYEEALSMSCAPSPNPVIPLTSRDRIAPDRPGAVPTIVLPPSYESSVRTEVNSASNSRNSAPIYTISSGLQITEC